jgi:HK97 family phage portal protein
VSVFSNIFSNKSPVPHTTRQPGRGLGSFIIPGGGRTTEGDFRRGLEQYGEVGTLFGIVSRIAEMAAEQEWCLYKKDHGGRRKYREVETREQVTRHAALDLLARPNPFMDQAEFIETLDQHFELTGESWYVAAYDERFRAAGPIELWPMRPDRVIIVTDYNDFLTGYIYVAPDGEQIPLEKEVVVQAQRRPNPLDAYRGLSPVQALRSKLDANRLATEYNRNFFLNSAEPGGIIEVEDRLDDDEFRELVSRWREQHQGVANAHRVAILEHGKWVDRKYTMRDMMFPELGTANKDDIREAFGYPKGMTGATEDVNKAVADANERMFGRYLLRPRLSRFRSSFNSYLLPMFGSTTKNLEFDFTDPVPEDREADNAERISKAQSFKLLVDAGVDGKDAAEVVGLPEVEWERIAAPEPFGRDQAGGDPKPNQNPDPAREAVK